MMMVEVLITQNRLPLLLVVVELQIIHQQMTTLIVTELIIVQQIIHSLRNTNEKVTEDLECHSFDEYAC